MNSIIDPNLNFMAWQTSQAYTIGTIPLCNNWYEYGGKMVSSMPQRAYLEYLTESIAIPVQTLTQPHGNQVVKAAKGQGPQVADACYTDQKNIACAVFTGDCCPIAITSSTQPWATMIHAGWRGLKAQIITQSLSCYSGKASDLIAWIGPCICQPCYEVDKSMFDWFTTIDFDYQQCFQPSKQNQGKLLFDCRFAAILELEKNGITTISHVNSCTFCDSEKTWYSYRRQGKSMIRGNLSLLWIN